MTSEAIRIAIAEKFGWKVENYGPPGYEKLYWRLRRPDGTIRCGECAGEEWSRHQFAFMVPHYDTDLNAMHEAFNSLALVQQIEFLHHLFKIVKRRCADNLGEESVRMVAVNARCGERAEAFLRTLNLYTTPSHVPSST